MNDTTPTQPLPEQSIAWLRHAAAMGRAEPQALLHLLERVKLLEATQHAHIDHVSEELRDLLQSAEPGRLIALERAEDEAFFPAAPQPDKLDPLAKSVFRAEDEAEAALPEPPSLSDYEARNLFLGGAQGSYEGTAACARRIHHIGWDAAMAAVKAQREQQQAAEATPAPAAIQAVRLVADWLERMGWAASSARDLRAEADHAEGELGRTGGPVQ